MDVYLKPSHYPLRLVGRCPQSYLTWAVFVSGLVGLAALLFFPAKAIVALEVVFPLWALLILSLYEDNLMAPTVAFPIIYLVWLWVGSIQILPKDAPSPSTILDAIPPLQWLYYLIGCIGYFAGTLAVGRPHPRFQNLLLYRPSWNRRHFILLISLTAVVTFTAWAAITLKEGIPIFHQDVAEARIALPDRHHIAYELEMIGTNFMLPLLFLYRWSVKSSRMLEYFLRGLIALGFFILISQGNRGAILPTLLTIAIMRHLMIKPWPLRTIALIATVALLAVGVTGYLRASQHFGETYDQGQVDLGIPPALVPFSEAYLYLRVPLTTFHRVTVMMPAVVPFQHGALTFGVITQILPGRHPSSDFFFKDLLGDTFTGFGEPASLLGTFYADWGPAGILLGMLGVGVMLSGVYAIMLRRPSAYWLIVYAYLLQKLISGIYGSLFEYLIELLLPCMWFVSLKYLTVSARTHIVAPS